MNRTLTVAGAKITSGSKRVKATEPHDACENDSISILKPEKVMPKKEAVLTRPMEAWILAETEYRGFYF